MAVSDGETITVVKDMGLVTAVFDERTLSGLSGHLAIGHTRYSTHGSSDWMAAQPVYRPVGRAGFALGHNGNLTNTAALAEEAGMLPGLVATDSDVVAELLAQAFPHDRSGRRRALRRAPAVGASPESKGPSRFVLLDAAPPLRRARPPGVPAAVPGAAGPGRGARGLGAGLGDPRPRRHRGHLRARARPRASWSPSTRRACGPSRSSRPSGSSPGCASSSSSTSPGPTPSSTAARSTAPGAAWASCWPSRPRWRPTWSWGSPTRGSRPPRATPARSGIPYGQGLVKNRYIGRTFIDPDQQARMDASGASSTRCARTSPASAWWSWTTRSCAARRPGPSWPCCATPAPPRCTCGSRPRRSRGPASTASTPPTAASCMAANHTLAEIERHLGVDSLAYISLENLKEAIDVARRRVLRRLPDRPLPGAGPRALPGLNGATVARSPAAPAAADPERLGPRRPSRRRSPGSDRVVPPGGDRAVPATYAGAGVDIAAGDAAVERITAVVASTARPEVLGGDRRLRRAASPSTPAATRQPVLVSSTDGVGTKLAVARATGRYDTIGIDLVAMCVDDLVCAGAEPLFLLDYLAVGKLVPEQVEQVVAGVAEGCRQAGCALLGGETAEHPGVMGADDLDLAGFAVGVVERDAMLGPDRVRAGDVLVGLASPGLRSNGYTLARHVLLERAALDLDGPAWPGADHSLADELLRPSVVYTPAVLAALWRPGEAVHAAAHITGGGLSGNLARVLPADLDADVERSSWAVPRIFSEIARLGAGGPRRRDGRGVQPRARHGARAWTPPPPTRWWPRSAAAGCPAGVVGEVAAGSGRWCWR